MTITADNIEMFTVKAWFLRKLNEEKVDFDYEADGSCESLERETEKAVLVRIPTFHRRTAEYLRRSPTYWVPKSCLQVRA